MLKSIYNKTKQILYKYHCPICNGNWNEWIESGFDYPVLNEVEIIGGGRRKHLCQNCAAPDRLRMIFSYMKSETSILNPISKISILHVAPERQLLEILMTKNKIEYYPCDKFNFNEIVKEADINDLKFSSNKFDYIICNHVLEHIQTDLKAMSELYRVLKKNGKAIVQIPYSTKIKKSIEDASVNNDESRKEKFGQWDHVRIYSKKDYIERLNKIGFKVKTINPFQNKFAYSPIKLGLNPKEDLFILEK